MRVVVFYLLSRGLSVLGLQILSTTFVLEALKLRSDAYTLGMLGLTATLTSFISTLPLGYGIDRIGRKRAWVSSQLFLFALSLVLSLYAALPKSLIFLGVTALVVLRNLRSIAQFSVFGDVLSSIHDREKWINLSTLSWQFAMVIGPLTAGFIKESHDRFSLAAAVFLVAMICQWPVLSRLSERRTTPLSARVSWHEIKSFFKTHAAMSSTLLLDFGIVLFGSSTAIVPFLNSTEGNPAAVGFLRASPSIGVIAATLCALKLPRTQNWKRGIFIATFGFGLSNLLLSVSPHWMMSAFLLFCAGYFDGISLSIREVLLQIDTPIHLKARIYAINNFLVNASDELGEWESGLTAHCLGLRRAIVLGSSITLALSLTFSRWSRALSKNTSQNRWDRQKSGKPLPALR